MQANSQQYPVSLANFEGPVDFLLYLVQKAEIDIYDIPIQKITEQYLQAIKEAQEQNVNVGAEFLLTASMLLLIKSRTLLPQDEEEEVLEEEADPRFEVIHQLLDYCHFRQMGKYLSKREDEERNFYYRAFDFDRGSLKRPIGLDEVTLDELQTYFKHAMAIADQRKGGMIDEEEWRVPDKIRAIRAAIAKDDCIPLIYWFRPGKSRGELIVTFLAMLELMKEGVIYLAKNKDELEMRRQ